MTQNLGKKNTNSHLLMSNSSGIIKIHSHTCREVVSSNSLPSRLSTSISLGLTHLVLLSLGQYRPHLVSLLSFSSILFSIVGFIHFYSFLGVALVYFSWCHSRPSLLVSLQCWRRTKKNALGNKKKMSENNKTVGI